MWNDDPLTHNAFADDDQQPSWPTTPHPPSPIPNLRRAGTSPPQTPGKDALGGPAVLDREPQIYGAPEAGLISPRHNTGVNGTQYEKPEPYLNVRITGLDRNRRDILIRFDAQTNLSNFTGTTYRNVQRSYVEFQQFCDAIAHNNPQTLVPALPLAQTSAPSDDEDDRLVRVMLQRWLARICADPISLHDEELRAFIESDFGYQPTPRPRKRAGSGFALMRRQVPDEDEELQRARFELTKLEGQFFDAAKALDRVSSARKGLATAHAEMGNKLVNVATTEAHPPIANAFRKIGRAWHSLADLDQAQAISECVILSDSLGYQGLNARAAKETLQQRTGVLEEYQAAVKSAISKRRQIERLKASSTIQPRKVDEALEELEEANKYEQILARRAEGISQNLHQALRRHHRQVTDDITAALIEHARTSLVYDRQLLKELEALRPDIAGAAAPAPPKNSGAPRPPFVPPLEDFNRPPLPIQPTPPPAAARSAVPQGPLPPQSPGAGSSRSPTTPEVSRGDEPPLGGRFVDGAKSMFVKPPLSAGSPAQSSAPISGFPPATVADPLAGRAFGPAPSLGAGDPLSRPASTTGLPPSGASSPNPGGYPGSASAGIDPLGGVRPAFMSASVRVQPTRSRLDAREAASKLANMF
ncbi:Vps5 C terminal like-domain-containing protein [Vararia minispora EC-137]|uniref:Vps5 C terminal like-domain-containing protein n=1 Tax=Vararia minispora EC-137 TaxID=1314806 RepID=A0ACB8QVX6_9AGAM|nr:Vps5 C terminal like-domain-containing protein [Vararia minispora EC-137]